MASDRFSAHSRVLRALTDPIRRFARADSNLLAAGETGTGKNAGARELHVAEVERRYIAATLRDVRGNPTEAARILGISRKALWEKRKRYAPD